MQALASKGWLVLQPNFRGSGGYGKAFAELGKRQWGDRMQDDVEDAVAEVVACSKADPAYGAGVAKALRMDAGNPAHTESGTVNHPVEAG